MHYFRLSNFDLNQLNNDIFVKITMFHCLEVILYNLLNETMFLTIDVYRYFISLYVS